MDPLQEELFRKLSNLLASGLSTEQIAREVDYQQSFLEQLLVREDFHRFFENHNPEAFSRWRTVRDEEDVDQEVQHYLRSRSLHNAKKLQELADKGELKPSEEKSVREILLKMSGSIHEEAIVDVVKISKAHLAALIETAAEVKDL